MPAHRLTGPPPDSGPAAKAVARVLDGTPLHEAADNAHLAPEVLTRLMEVFADAGYQAVADHTNHNEWWQADVEFDPHHDHDAAARLTDLLDTAHSDGHLTRWWFLHKHPGWRLRLRPATCNGHLRLEGALDELADAGTVRGWRTGIYEPETAAFGGPTGMDIAHALFCADSHAIAHLPAETDLPLGRKQFSLMLCTELMHAARLEPFEHGDVWDQVCHLRPLPTDVDPARVQAMVDPAQTLLGADTAPDGAMFGPDGALSAHTAWAAAFSTAGACLGQARFDGTLHRGIRAIVAYHVVFHWNRLSLGAGAQAALARTARAAVLDVPVSTARIPR